MEQPGRFYVGSKTIILTLRIPWGIFIYLFLISFHLFIFYTAGSYQLSILYILVYTCQSQSPSSSHHHPRHRFPPLASLRLFSTPVSLFLPCKPVYLYHFSRFHIYVLAYGICFLFLTYFTVYDSLQIHPCLYKWPNFIPFYSWVVFRSIYVPHLLYPFIYQCAFRLLPLPGYCK